MSEQQRRDLRLSGMHEAFCQSFQSEAPFREDRELAGELAAELAPVLDALLQAHCDDAPDGAVGHEAAALITLLSRRAGVLGATPTAAGALLRGLFAALRAAELTQTDRTVRDLTTLVFEGYAAGCEERTLQGLHRSLAAAHTLLELAPRVFVLRLLGAADPALLATALEEVERELLRRDALVLIVELSDLSEPSDDFLRALMGLVATARSLGVHVLMTNARPDLWTQLETMRIDASGLTRHDSFSFAVGEALRIAGYEIKPRRRWSRPFFRRAALRASGAR